ncbi:MAG: hypothetical protein RLZZ455_1089, partial [Candidatus Parcubacteria bacterium]
LINPSAAFDRAKTAKGKSFQGQLLRSLGFYNSGAWNFNNSSVPGEDTSGSNITGTLVGSPVYTANCDLGLGGCISFDGVDDTIALGDIAALKTDNKTIMFWAKPAISPTGTVIIFGNGGANYYVGLTTTNRLIVSYGRADNTQQTLASPNNSVDINSWHHYAFSFKVTGTDVVITMYKDGNSIQTNSFITGYGTTYGSSFRLGGLSAGANLYSGSLDEVYFFNQTLSQASIRAHYAKRLTDDLIAIRKTDKVIY